MKALYLLLLIALMPYVSGCGIGILVAGIGAASMMDKQGKAKIIAAQTDREKLRLEYEQLNLERQKAGLEPIPVPEELKEKPPMLTKELQEKTITETGSTEIETRNKERLEERKKANRRHR